MRVQYEDGWEETFITCHKAEMSFGLLVIFDGPRREDSALVAVRPFFGRLEIFAV
jgi:hypothetical protein